MEKFSDKQLRFLRDHQVGRLATASKDADPHVAALCYAADYDHIYIHTGMGTRKGRNILENNRVAFIVDEYLGWDDFRGIIIQGVANFHRSGPSTIRPRRPFMGNIPYGRGITPSRRGSQS